MECRYLKSFGANPKVRTIQRDQNEVFKPICGMISRSPAMAKMTPLTLCCLLGPSPAVEKTHCPIFMPLSHITVGPISKSIL